MCALNRMTRMVSFRVSDEEYKQLSETCLALNARSLSDLTREAVHFWMENAGPSAGSSLTGRLRKLEEKVEELEADLARLSEGRANGV